MYVAAINEKPFEFVKKRLIRIIPLYWIATICLLLILTKFHPFSISAEEFDHFIKSFLFIPHYSPSHPDKIYPYLIPGWTLNYEMFFYVIFFTGLLLRRTVFFCSLAIIGLTVSGYFFNYHNVVMKAYSSPILLEFLGGMFVGYWYRQKSMIPNLGLLILIGFSGLFLIPFLQIDSFVMLLRIICSLLIIIGAVSLSKATYHSPFLNLLGDSSYSIYLTHSVFSIRVAYKILTPVPITGLFQFITWVLLTLFISIVVGIFVYIYIEKPTLAWLRSKLIRRV